MITADLKTVLEEANVSADNIQAVVDDFQAIVGSGMEATQPLLSVLGKLAHECLPNPTPTPLPAIHTLLTNLKAIVAAGSFTPEQLAAIKKDIGALHASGDQPSDETTTKFLNDVISLTSETDTPVDPATLKADFVAMLQSANFSPHDVENLVGAVLKSHDHH